MQFIKDNFKLICLSGVAVAFIGLFLPFITISVWGYGESVSLFSYFEGKVIFACLIVAGIMIGANELNKSGKGALADQISGMGGVVGAAAGKFAADEDKSKFAIIPAVIAIVVAIYTYMSCKSEAGSYVDVSLGFGFFVVIIGCVMIGAIFFEKQIIGLIDSKLGNNTLTDNKPSSTETL